MADRKPVRGIARNPFPRKSVFLRRNTRGSRWVREPSNMDGSVAKYPQVVHQSSFAKSLKAVSQHSLPINNIRSDSASTAHSSFYHPGPAVYDVSEVPDTNIFAFDGPLTDDGFELKASQLHAGSGKAERRYSSPDTPKRYFPAPAVPLSPLPSFGKNSGLYSQPPSLFDGSMLPIVDKLATPDHVPNNPTAIHGEQRKVSSMPQHIGWDDFRSSRASLNATRDVHPASVHNIWPESDKQAPPPASYIKPCERVTREEKGKRFQAPPTPHTKTSRKQSDLETMMRVRKFGKKLKVVYHQGPKGEGQKMWSGIRRKPKETRELKHTQAPWAARAEAQKEQLNDLHAAALDMPAPKAPLTSPPLQSQSKPAVPDRPAPLGVVRSPVIHRPLPGAFPMQLRERLGNHGKVNTQSAYTYHSWDVPVTASRSVQYDSQESVIDYSQSMARVPILDPAPRPKPVQKKGLPPRPVLAPGEEEPPEVAEQEKMYKLRVGTGSSQPRVDSLPSASNPLAGSISSTTPPKSQNNNPAGNSLAVGYQFPCVATKSHNAFAFREDRQAQRPRNKEPKHRLNEAFPSLFDVPSRPKEKHPKEIIANLSTHQKDKARTKHQQKLKAQISAPRPVLAPNGFTANFSAAAGGIGGPAAAVAVAPQVSNPAYTKGKSNGRSVDAGKLQTSTKLLDATKAGGVWDTIHDARRKVPCVPPPVPPLPADYVVQRVDSQADLHARGKAKKEKKANWAVPFSLTRRDSDASMVCAHSHHISREHQDAQDSQQKQRPRRRDSGVLNMMTFKGPVRQHPPAPVKGVKVREPGPSRQVERRQFEDESLVPEPLGIRKSEGARTDTSFYQKYDSLIREYKGGEGTSGWI